ncbi:hypothetical protein [uncultured Mucilaginibacter sp.]|uniref:hypothetical protein n=1 Tax=uncultured Mucilaginibacter sp. TaxID=797541 RepID=UPI0025FC7797|nr:hypothetical protein [uncultured Mucilaginibacter sp.]
MKLEASLKLKVFQKYIGEKVWVKSLHPIYWAQSNQILTLTGIKGDALQLFNPTDRTTAWYTIKDTREPQFEFKLLLKPLKQLTPEIQAVAQALPAPPFIIQYYVDLGFDMPLFFKPGHPGNQQNAFELGLAVYDTEEAIIQKTMAAISPEKREAMRNLLTEALG